MQSDTHIFVLAAEPSLFLLLQHNVLQCVGVESHELGICPTMLRLHVVRHQVHHVLRNKRSLSWECGKLTTVLAADAAHAHDR